MTETCAPIFFTVHNPNGMQNPNSMLILEALELFQKQVLKLNSPAEYRLISGHPAAIAFFDYDAVPQHVNHWRIMSHESLVVPPWTRLGRCAVAVTSRCTKYPPHTLFMARQIEQQLRVWQRASSEA